MDLILFGKALLVGLAVAAPVGPIGLICIQRTLTRGIRAGIASGLGAATADAVYGAVGVFGLALVTQLVNEFAWPMSLAGGIFLAWLGLRFLRAGPQDKTPAPVSARDTLHAFLSTLALTLANPMTILSFIAIFAALSGGTVLNQSSGSLLVVGVFLGSALWWLTMAGGVVLIRHRIDPSVITWINRITGLFLLCFAGWQLRSLLA